MKTLVAAAVLLLAATAVPAAGAQPLFDPAEFLDESTLDVVVLDDWHVDTVNGTTRQKLVDIHVAEWWPGFEYRVMVRYIVPTSGPATGIHLTGSHSAASLLSDSGVSGFDAELIAGGIGLVHTVVQASLTGGSATGEAMVTQFIGTLSARYSNIWIWAMNEMRALTAAYTETAHFIPGKVAATGGSKNCMTPVVASINDARFTAVRGTVCSPWLSPLDVYDEERVAEVEAANTWFFGALADGSISPGVHTEGWYAANAFGAPDNLHVLALQAGWTWEEIRAAASSWAPYVHLSETYASLVAGGTEYLFHPGTHDWVAFDLVEGQAAYPEIPVYIEANAGHNQPGHPAGEADENNQRVFLRRHFFGTATPMLETPVSSHSLDGDQLSVAVTFTSGPEPASGRIWWLYDRPPGGSGAYLWDMIPDEQFADMTFDPVDGAWKASIHVDLEKGSVDFWSNHGHLVDGTQTYLSSPYTRVDLPTNVRVKCQRVITKESVKFAKTRSKALVTCERRKIKGQLSSGADCDLEPTTAQQILKAGSKMAGKIDKACGGDDDVCNGDVSEDIPAAFGWGGSCPNLESGSCDDVIGDCGDIADCVQCIHTAATSQANDLYYGSMFIPTVDLTLRKCQEAVGREMQKFQEQKAKLIQKCWDKRIQGKHSDTCPDAGAAVGRAARKAADRIAKAQAKAEQKVCKACGGGDKVCGGGDDFDPATEIGFQPTCNDVTIPGGASCSGTVTTLQDLVDCVTCVTEFKVDCMDRSTVRTFETYPAECNP